MGITSHRISVVGDGNQGSGIAHLLVEQGHTFVGAVDIGDKVGKPLSRFLDGVGPDVAVLGSIEDLIGGPEFDSQYLPLLSRSRCSSGRRRCCLLPG